MALVHGADVEAYEMFPGVVRKVVNHGEKTMILELRMKKGAVVPEHKHPHEQLGYVFSGKVEFRAGDETKVLGPGDSWLAPGGVPHTLTVLEDCVAVDVFSPPREDYLTATPIPMAAEYLSR
jgi:quercetin dioxygenase-like cupin family protein